MKTIALLYESGRSFIVLLVLMELKWMGNRISSVSSPVNFLVLMTAWLTLMLLSLWVVILFAKKDVFFKYNEQFSNLIGFFAVIVFALLAFGCTEFGRQGTSQRQTRSPIPNCF